MTLRRSLRLQGLAPEFDVFQDRCFVCLLWLDIDNLLQATRLECCGKFLHKRCAEMLSGTRTCGHCKRPKEAASVSGPHWTFALDRIQHFRDNPEEMYNFHSPESYSFRVVSIVCWSA